MPQQHLINQFMGCLEELKGLDLEGITRVLAKAKHIYSAGNGGSSATASHFAADLARIGLRATCLSDNITAITSFANDVSYDQIFAVQLDIIRRHDALVVLSVSGQSVNLLNAVKAANSKGATTIAFTGSNGGKLREIAKYTIPLSSDKYGEVEGIHSCICHMIPVLIQEVRHDQSRVSG